jgi:flagellar basal-body rod protein FlgB
MEEHMSIKGIFGSTIEVLAQNIDLRARNHNQLAANIANMETPQYTPSRLDFENELKGALNTKKTGSSAITNERHIPLKGQSDSVERVRGKVVATPSTSVGRDGNRVDIEGEMSRLAENQILYNASVQLIAKKFDGLRQAIRGTGN